MIDFLKDGGIEGCTVKRLTGTMRDGRAYKTAAFIITCENKYEDIILDDNN